MANIELLKVHKRWINAQKCTYDGNIPECESCGCIGNQECKHAPLDDDECCTLDSLLVCPCCNALKNYQRTCGNLAFSSSPENYEMFPEELPVLLEYTPGLVNQELNHGKG